MTSFYQRLGFFLLSLTGLILCAPQGLKATDLALTKSTSSTAVTIGDEFTYTLTVDNSSTTGGGPFNSPNTVITDNVPSALKIVSATFDNGNTACQIDGQMVRCEIGTVDQDAEATVTIRVIACATGTVTNEASVTGELDDPDDGNNTGTATVTIGGGLSVVKVADSGEVDVGDFVTFTATITNNRGTEATGVVATETFAPTTWTYSGDTGGCTNTASVTQQASYKCDIGTLGPGEMREYAFVLQAKDRSQNPLDPLHLASGRVQVQDSEGGIAADGATVAVRGRIHLALFIFLAAAGGSEEAAFKQAQTDPVDIYLDNQRLLDDIMPGQAVGYVNTLHLNTNPTFYLVDGNDPDAATPIDSFTVNMLVGEDGNETFAERSLFVFTADADNRLLVIPQHNPATEAADPNAVEVVFIHANAGAPPLTLRLIDDTPAHTLLQTLTEEAAFGSLSDPFGLSASAHNLEVIASDGSQALGVFQLDMSSHSGQVLTVAATQEDETGLFTVAAYDTSGAPVASAVVTDTEAETALPKRFALQGNYPNPFNPVTQLVFDLPEAAAVRVDLFDMLGRRVLTLPAQPRAAGAGQTLRLDASALSSGMYLYRLIAQTTTRTLSETRRLMLIK